VPDRAGLSAEELLERADEAAGRFAAGLEGLSAESKPQAREQARRMLVFVVLSVLLESRPGQNSADRDTAEKLKAAFAEELIGARKALRALTKQDPAKPAEDPFAPYYDSFQKMRKDPAQGPFGVLARRISETYFEPVGRAAAYERAFTLAAVLSDELVSKI
jgi:hypothetical protein